MQIRVFFSFTEPRGPSLVMLASSSSYSEHGRQSDQESITNSPSFHGKGRKSFLVAAVCDALVPIEGRQNLESSWRRHIGAVTDMPSR